MEREVFTDFVGRQFRFPASEGEVYSLITEADHQINALLQPGDGGLSQTLGITMRGVGIHGTDTSVKVSGGDDGLLAGKEQAALSTELRCDLRLAQPYSLA